MYFQDCRAQYGDTMSVHQLNIREVRQGASGGSTVVSFSAELELLDTSEPIAVEILSVVPADALVEIAESARNAILSGARRALESRGKSAVIKVRGFLYHDVDYNPARVALCTARAIEELP